MYRAGVVYDHSGHRAVLRRFDSWQERSVDADAGDGDVRTGLHFMGGVWLLAGLWRGE
ncbi:hypothetical protein D3C73_1444740 [compost metagenome]